MMITIIIKTIGILSLPWFKSTHRHNYLWPSVISKEYILFSSFYILSEGEWISQLYKIQWIIISFLVFYDHKLRYKKIPKISFTVECSEFKAELDTCHTRNKNNFFQLFYCQWFFVCFLHVFLQQFIWSVVEFHLILDITMLRKFEFHHNMKEIESVKKFFFYLNERLKTIIFDFFFRKSFIIKLFNTFF